MTQLPLLGGSEANPFRPDVPASLQDVSPELYQHLWEQGQLLRESHWRAQAGDTTFSWEQLTLTESQPSFNLGSIGRFYHPTFGILRARYVRFADMSPSGVVGGPVGLRVTGVLEPWVVTDDLSRSNRKLVVGLMGAYARPTNDSYGWAIIEGPNIQDLVLLSPDELALFDKAQWAQTDRAGIGFAGTNLGSLLQVGGETEDSPVIIAGDSYRRWTIPAGRFFVSTGGDSETLIRQWIQDETSALAARVTTTETAISDLQGNNGLGGLTVRVQAAETAITTLSTQLSLESQQRSLSLEGVNDRIDQILESLGAAGDLTGLLALSASLSLLQTSFDSYTGTTNLRLSALEATSLALVEFQKVTEQQIPSILGNISTINSTLSALPTTYVPRLGVTVDNNIVRFDGTTGLIQDSLASISDLGEITCRRLTITDPATNIRLLRLQYAPLTGAFNNAIEVSNGTINVLELQMNQTATEGNLFLRAPTGQGSGAGLTLQSDVGGTQKQFLFQLDSGGDVVLRQTHGSTFFDYFSGVNFRDSGFVTRASISAGGIVSCNGGFRPIANDVGALGSATLSFADLFLASGAVINFNNGNLTLTHSAGQLACSGTITVADSAYNASTWDGSTAVPTRNAVRDEIEALRTTVNSKLTGAVIVAGNATTPSLLSPWVGLAGHQAPRYFKSAEGLVVLEGVISAAGGTPTASVILFNLPAGFRPGADLAFCGWCGAGAYRINIKAGGDVELINCDTGITSICGVSFFPV